MLECQYTEKRYFDNSQFIKKYESLCLVNIFWTNARWFASHFSKTVKTDHIHYFVLYQDILIFISLSPTNEWSLYNLNKVGLWVNLFSSGWCGSVENVSITNAMQLFLYSETIFRFVLFISVNQNAKILKNDWITENKILPNLKHLDWRRSLNKDL